MIKVIVTTGRCTVKTTTAIRLWADWMVPAVNRALVAAVTLRINCAAAISVSMAIIALRYNVSAVYNRRAISAGTLCSPAATVACAL